MAQVLHYSRVVSYLLSGTLLLEFSKVCNNDQRWWNYSEKFSLAWYMRAVTNQRKRPDPWSMWLFKATLSVGMVNGTELTLFVKNTRMGGLVLSDLGELPLRLLKHTAPPCLSVNSSSGQQPTSSAAGSLASHTPLPKRKQTSENFCRIKFQISSLHGHRISLPQGGDPQS